MSSQGGSSAASRDDGQPTAARLGLTRGRTLTLVLLASVVLVITGRTPWLVAASTTAIRSHQVSLSGSEVAPAVSAAALVGLAGVAALALAKGIARRVTLGLVAAAGVLGMWAAGSVLRDPAGSAAGRTIDSGTGTVAAQVTAWPWLSVAAGLLLTMVALAGLVLSGSWDAPKQRFESSAQGAPVGVAHDWDALSRGEDPTRDSLAE